MVPDFKKYYKIVRGGVPIRILIMLQIWIQI
jgi:hypothetical protein